MLMGEVEDVVKEEDVIGSEESCSQRKGDFKAVVKSSTFVRAVLIS